MAIAIALTGILLSVLFRFLVSNARFEHSIKQASAVVMHRQRVQERLETVFSNLEVPESGSGKFYTTLFPEEPLPSLVLYFNAGIDIDPSYSHAVIGRIYLTEEGDLCLSYWPRSKEGYRTEVLLQDVRDFQWQFLGHKEDKNTKATMIAESWAWLHEWPKKLRSAPQIIRLCLWCGIDKKKYKEPNLQFAFVLPAQEPIHMYK